MRVWYCLLVVSLSAAAGLADDWPQWMGPQRDNVWRETGIVSDLPDAPKFVWRTPIAGGYAGPAVANGRVYVTDYVTDQDVKVDNFSRQEFTGAERVLCLDEQSGDILWKYEYPVKYTISYPAGPRCTPTVDGDKVYVLGAEGNLFCFDAEKGDILWQKDLKTEYNTKAALWGWASHPLVDGQKLLCVVGGEGSHAVAFDKDSGKELWRARTAPVDGQGYAPPTIIEAGGKRQWILLAPDAVSSLDPETGAEYWSVPYEASNGSIIMSPIQDGEYLYVGGYSNRNLLLKLASDRPAAEVVWQDEAKKAMSPVNVQPYAQDGVLYGCDQNGELMAVDIKTGDRLWTTTKVFDGGRSQGSATAFMVRHEDRCVMFTELGELVFAKLSPQGYEEIDRMKVLEPTNNAFGRPVLWCQPAFANGRMYVRNDSEIACIDLRK